MNTQVNRAKASKNAGQGTSVFGEDKDDKYKEGNPLHQEPLTGRKRPRNNEVRTQKKKIAGTQESQIGYVEAFLYKSFPKGWLVANTSYVKQSLIESSTTRNLRPRSKY